MEYRRQAKIHGDSGELLQDNLLGKLWFQDGGRREFRQDSQVPHCLYGNFSVKGQCGKMVFEFPTSLVENWQDFQPGMKEANPDGH